MADTGDRRWARLQVLKVTVRGAVGAPAGRLCLLPCRAMAVPGAAEFTARPESGRVYEGTRRVRLSDVDPSGRCRLDALARFMQDVARDDSSDADVRDPMGWVVRRMMLEVRRPPRLRELVELSTWCSGHGSRWAERRTSLRGHRGAEVESVTVWVCVDSAGRPRRLGEEFFDIYGDSAAGRDVSVRKSLPAAPAADACRLPWSLRHADFDVLGHVNNAAQWQAVEETLARVELPSATEASVPHRSSPAGAASAKAEAARSPLLAELEHGAGIAPGAAVELHWKQGTAAVDCWLLADGKTAAAARISRL